MSMVASRIRSAEKSQSDPHWHDDVLFYEHSGATMAPASRPATKADVTRVIARLMQAHALVMSEALLTGQHWRSLQGSPTRGPINGHRAATNLHLIWDGQGSRSLGIRYCVRLFVNDPAQTFEIPFRKRRQLPSDPEGATARPEIGTIGEI